MTSPPPELLEFLDRYEPAVRSLALDLRTLVHEEMAPCHEYIFEMRSKVVLLYGATERVIEDGLCNIGIFTHHVLLGFPRGAELDDPAGVLRGTGKAMRHISIRQRSDFDAPEVRAYLQRARTHAGLERRRHALPDDVVTRVKPKPRVKRPGWPPAFR